MPVVISNLLECLAEENIKLSEENSEWKYLCVHLPFRMLLTKYKAVVVLLFGKRFLR